MKDDAMDWWKRAVVIAVATGVLAACADPQPPEKHSGSHHVSPAAVAAPVLPQGSFDHAQEQAALAQAQSVHQSGDLTQARALTETAINLWPADPQAWSELGSICQAQKDNECARRAAFFHDKVEYVNPLPARVGVLGFQSIAEEGVTQPGQAKKKQPGSMEAGDYDQPTIDMARRLWAFYNTQDPAVQNRNAKAPEPSWTESHPYATMAVIGGGVAGIITGVKSIANK